MSTMILGRSGKTFSKRRVGNRMRLTLASIGFPLRMKISADWVSATSMRGLEPNNCRVSIGSLLESSS